MCRSPLAKTVDLLDEILDKLRRKKLKIKDMVRGGIQRKLVIALLLLAIVPMVVMGFISFYNASRVLVDQTNDQMRNLTLKAVEQVEAVISLSKMQMDHLFLPFSQVLTYLEVGMQLDVGTKENLLRDLASYQKKYPEILRVRLFDNKGVEKFSTRQAAANSQNELSSPWFQKALNSKEACFSEMFPSKELNEAVIIAAKGAFSQEGKPVGVLVIEFSGKYVTRTLESIKVGKEGSYAYILNQEGTVIVHPDPTKVFQLRLNEYGFGKEMLQKKTGVIEYDWEGKAKVAAYRDYPAMGWIIAAAADKDDILASLNQMRTLFLMLGIAIAVAAVIIAVFLSARIASPINRAISGLTENADQVASASAQVTSAGQSLAEGASEQAAGLEETSSSLEEMSSMTRQNADNAHQAKTMVGEAQQVVENVNHHMSQMGQAITEITKSSEETGKIIKTIDEIAFQTNLLALNAAVEAARAGEAGAGFAVVADEVRNLAMRAAEAAKNTSNLIENTIKSVKRGSEFTLATQEAFKRNVEVAAKIGKLIDEIAVASQEQARGIEQVSKSVAEMDKVVQKNAASAEESASAAGEMNAQAEQMKGFVGELVALVGGRGENGKESVTGKGPHHAGVGSERIMEGPALRPPTKHVPCKMKKEKDGAGSRPQGKEVNAEQVIPLGEGGFEEF